MTSTSCSIASPLANRVYRHLYLAQISALTGTGVMTVGLALLAYQLAGDHAGAVLGIALSLRIVAFVLISPLIGAYVHLLPRRGLLVALDLLRAATVLLLPFVDAVWQVYVLIFVINACSAGFTPLFQATIPDVLPDEATYTRALSLSRLAYDLEQLLAPMLAGVLLWFLPLDALFAVNGAAFLLSAALVLSVTLPGARKVTRPEGVLANIGWGIRLYLATPRLRVCSRCPWPWPRPAPW
jgi:MFS family permease